MKYLICLVFLSCTFIFENEIYSQDEDFSLELKKSKITFGGQLGGSVSMVKLNTIREAFGGKISVDDGGKEPHFGVHVGLAANFILNDYFTIHTGVGFTNRGYEQTFYEDYRYLTRIQSKVDLRYVDIPLSGKVHFGNSQYKFYIEGGVFGNRLITSRQRDQYFLDGGKTKVLEKRLEVNEEVADLRMWDLGTVYGAGFQFWGNDMMIEIGGRFFHSHRNFVKFTDGNNILFNNDDVIALNRTFTFFVGFHFDMKKDRN